MKYSILVVVQAALALGQATSPDCSSVCEKTTGIQSSCSQPGMKVSDHANCMCTGNTAGERFFSSWTECRKCSQTKPEWFQALDIASAALCSGTPTASFQPIYASAANHLGLDVAFDGQSEAAPSQTPAAEGAASSPTTTTRAQPAVTSQTESSGAVQPATTAAPTTAAQSSVPGSAKPSTGASAGADRNTASSSTIGRNGTSITPGNKTPLTGGAAAQAVSGLLAISVGAVALMW